MERSIATNTKLPHIVSKSVLSISHDPSRVDARRDIHAHELLEEQLAGIRDLHLRELDQRPIPTEPWFYCHSFCRYRYYRSSYRSVRSRRRSSPRTRPTSRRSARAPAATRRTRSAHHAPSLPFADLRRASGLRAAGAWGEGFDRVWLKDIPTDCSFRGLARGSCRPRGASGAGRTWGP